MNHSLIHTFRMSAITILLSTAVCVGGTISARAQGVDQMQKLQHSLESVSEKERCGAVYELSAINSEASSQLLLKQLKRNLANKRGYYIEYGSISVPNGTLWTATHSENELLVTALGNRKYNPALQTFQKMLKKDEKWLGISKEFLAANIYLISPQPVKYSVNGDARIYPAPDTYSDLMPSFLLPAAGELAWAEESPNDRLRDIVSILGQVSGPLDSHPLYKILKEEFGQAKLVELVKGNDPLLRPYAVEALGILNEQRNETFALLMATIVDPEPRMRVRSVRALSRMLTSGNEVVEFAPIVPALMKALHDPEAEVRYYAIAPLARYILSHPADMNTTREVVSLFLSALNDHVGAVRSEAAQVLGWVGPATDQVVPALIHLLKSQNKNDREAAVKGLGQLLHTNAFQQSPERKLMEGQIWQAFILAARDPASSVRYEIAEVVGGTAPATRRAVPILIKLTRDPSSGVRTSAARALGEFEVDRLRITSALAAMLNVPGEEDEVIEFALSALRELGTQARAAAPEVRKLLRSKRPRLHDSALDTLDKISAQQEP
jgi:HEAT repeat protein